MIEGEVKFLHEHKIIMNSLYGITYSNRFLKYRIEQLEMELNITKKQMNLIQDKIEKMLDGDKV